jgi:hypothetical protein
MSITQVSYLPDDNTMNLKFAKVIGDTNAQHRTTACFAEANKLFIPDRKTDTSTDLLTPIYL